MCQACRDGLLPPSYYGTVLRDSPPSGFQPGGKPLIPPGIFIAVYVAENLRDLAPGPPWGRTADAIQDAIRLPPDSQLVADQIADLLRTDLRPGQPAQPSQPSLATALQDRERDGSSPYGNRWSTLIRDMVRSSLIVSGPQQLCLVTGF